MDEVNIAAEVCGKYLKAVYIAVTKGRLLFLLIVAQWYALPVAFATLFYPSDAIELVYKFEGLPPPGYAYWHQLIAGEISAVLALLVLCGLLLFSLTRLYKRLGFSFPLWPLSVVLVGFIGNGAWWFGTGGPDFWGAVCGFASVGALVVVQGFSEEIGQDFSFGEGNRPEYGEYAQ